MRTPAKRFISPHEWHSWFAWYLVEIGAVRVWWERVERRAICGPMPSGQFIYDYRFPTT